VNFLKRFTIELGPQNPQCSATAATLSSPRALGSREEFPHHAAMRVRCWSQGFSQSERLQRSQAVINPSLVGVSDWFKTLR
jgi:hypothetical protein